MEDVIRRQSAIGTQNINQALKHFRVAILGQCPNEFLFLLSHCIAIKRPTICESRRPFLQLTPLLSNQIIDIAPG
ncbi:hypothetical protein WJ74_01085 [Burkholderia ubonensis]|nr:hypothetical protein WJ74_01085 [Burkholderia ubonensis]